MVDVSVIIPTLNEEKYLGKCLESLKRQKFNGTIEVIIGDGNSKDRTHAIAKKYGAKVVVEKKKTISAGRQKACDIAKGKIIFSTDADMIAPPHVVQDLYNAYEKGVVVAYGNVIPYDGTAMETIGSQYLMPVFLRVMELVGKPNPIGSNFSFSRAAFKKIGGWDTGLVTGEDVDLGARLLKHGKAVYVPSATVGVSMRRVRGWGTVKYLLFHFSNAARMLLGKKPHGEYEAVR